MNIFYLDHDPTLAARWHCDKHVVKMILEYGQMLSTAHRILDGTPIVMAHPTTNRKKRHWLLLGEEAYVNDEGKWKIRKFDIVDYAILYATASENHPCNIWVREYSANYRYLYYLFRELLDEYTYRYGKVHKAARLIPLLEPLPKNIRIGLPTPPALAMPDEYKDDDAVTAYQNLYVGSKSRFAKWTKRVPPHWFTQRIPNYNEADFTGKSNLADATLDYC